MLMAFKSMYSDAQHYCVGEALLTTDNILVAYLGVCYQLGKKTAESDMRMAFLVCVHIHSLSVPELVKSCLYPWH